MVAQYLTIIELLDKSDDEFKDFFNNNKDFFADNNIRPYTISKKLDSDYQKKFISKIEEMNLSIDEKREVFASLNTEVKDSIDAENLPQEYKSALELPSTQYGSLILDLDKNLEDYRGLDNLLIVNADEFTQEQKTQFIKLCDICPNLQVNSILNGSIPYASTAQEYVEAEKWISSIIDNLDPSYSDAQKLAIIDNAIGKKISYSPDFETEVYNSAHARAPWKIISSGYGVCLGISRVEQYMLNRIGIESEIISSDSHAFLKIKDIELPFSNGEVKKGNTILDPTWNLSSHRFSGKPNNFCISYAEARENDIDYNGNDSNCHKNDEKLQDATLSLDEQSLRQLFSSVGLADEKGIFPVNNLLNMSDSIHEIYKNDPDTNIEKQLFLLSQTHPEFATCQNSTMTILSAILSNENLNLDKCIVNRVYDKTDDKKNAVLYVYATSNELGKKFYFADKQNVQFSELSQEDFESRFECYDNDLKKSSGIRPWEYEEQKNITINDTDLSKSSGNLVAKEGNER